MDANLMTMIAVAVLVIAALVVSFVSAKTYGWLHVSLAFSIFLAALAFIVMAAGVLRYQTRYRNGLAQVDQQITALKVSSRALVHGPDGAREIRNQLDQLTLGRGRVWRGVEPRSVDAAGPSVEVQLPEGSPPTIAADMTLQVFEEGSPNDGAEYLGEFIVSTVAGGVVTLQPALPLTNRETERMADSQATWVLYEIMPIDRSDLLQSLGEDELSTLFPPDYVAEILQDGQPAGPTAPPDRVRNIAPEGEPERLVFARPLQDYQLQVHDALNVRARTLDQLRQTEQGLAQMRSTLELANQDIARRREEIERLTSDRARLDWELTVAQRMASIVDSQSMRLVERLNDTMARNRQLAAVLAEAQLTTPDQISVGP
jgi:hypothetical protein